MYYLGMNIRNSQKLNRVDYKKAITGSFPMCANNLFIFSREYFRIIFKL